MLRRALSKGFTLATRTKRTYVFVAIFTFLVIVSIITINSIYQYETDSLLNIRGCIVRLGVTKTEFENSQLFSKLSEIRSYARGIYVVYGLVINLHGTYIGFVWLDSWENTRYKPELPWVVDEIKPTKIDEGRELKFDSNADEAVIGKSFNVSFNLGTLANISTVTGVGGAITFQAKGSKRTLRIVGRSIESFSSFASVLGVDANSIIFVTKSFIIWLQSEILSELYGTHIDDHIYALRLIITAAGDVFSIQTLLGINNIIDKNRDKIYDLVRETGFEPQGISIIRGKQLLNVALGTFVSFLLLLFIGTSYAFLLTTFRRMDIATLRAIGWDSSHIFVLILGEFMLTIFTGLFFGVIFAGAFFFINNIPSTIYPFLAATTISIVSLLIGLVIIKKKVLKIPPMEAFRAQ